MKKRLRLSALLALIFVPVLASTGFTQPKTYMGLYVDEGRSICRQDISHAYMSFTLWVWVFPSEMGFICAEFKLSSPNWLLNVGTVENPGASSIIGGPYAEEGVSICLSSCQTDWVWLYRITQLPTAAGLPGFVEIVEHPGAGEIRAAHCG